MVSMEKEEYQFEDKTAGVVCSSSTSVTVCFGNLDPTDPRPTETGGVSDGVSEDHLRHHSTRSMVE